MKQASVNRGRGERRSLLRLGRVFARACALSLAALREIFDESAYARFLARHQMHSSAEAYSAFLHERAQTQAQRPRCC